MKLYLALTLCLYVLAISTLCAAFAQGTENSTVPDFEEVLKILDERDSFPGDAAATILMEEKDPVDGESSTELLAFRRDADDLFLLLIKKPTTLLGQGYLKLKDGFFFYDPESRNFQYTAIEENFRGSDARNSDFQASGYAFDYDVESYTETKLGKYDVWQLELTAAHEEAPASFLTIYVTKDSNLLLKEVEYTQTKRILRTSYYPSYKHIDGIYIAEKEIIVDGLVEGRSTTMTVTDISLADLPENVFTKAYIERVNR